MKLSNDELALAIEAAHTMTHGYGSTHPTYVLFSSHLQELLLEQQKRACLVEASE